MCFLLFLGVSITREQRLSHYRREWTDEWGQVTIREACPDGIPEATLYAKVDHKTPYPGDHGLMYLPVDPETSETES